MRRLAIAVFGALAFSAAPAHAATFQVNTTEDIATRVQRGRVLAARRAVQPRIANGSLEDDVINVPAGAYAVG